jgi:DNA-binding beta-propeller fold protein YncE
MMNIVRILFYPAAFLILFFLIGCGSSKQLQQSTLFVWPLPPDEPRIQYLRTFRGEDDFGSGLSSIITALGGKTRTMNLQRPFDVCTDRKGTIYVSDIQLGVIKFDTLHREVVRLKSSATVSLKNPRGLDYNNGKLFVGLADVGQIAVVDSEGSLQYMIGRQGQFQNPVDVVCDTNKHRLLIVDNKQHTVFVYTENGDSLFSIGGRGEDDGQLNFPQAVAVDGQSNIYVVDAFNFRIQIFDSTGKYLRKFGEQGDWYGAFARPKGIALDTYGNIYVLDAVHQHFQIFNQEGKLLLFVGRFSADNDGFQNPVSIHIDRTNRIYVTDQLNQRVQVFQLVKGD